MSENKTIYSNNPYTLYDDNQFYRVTKGNINLFAVLKSGKKEFISTVKTGEIFFSLTQLFAEDISLEFSAGSVEPMITTVDYGLINMDELKQSIQRFSSYVSFELEKLAEVNSVHELYSFLNMVFIDVNNDIKSSLKIKREQEVDKLNIRVNNDNKLTKSAIVNLAAIFDKTLIEEENTLSDDVLIDTVNKICHSLDIDTQEIDKELISDEDPINDISRTLNVRVRQVKLENQWHENDNGTLLGFTTDMIPVALIPKNTNSYFIVNLKTNTKTVATKENIEEILNKAYMFYKPLPQRVLTTKDIFAFISFSNRKDFFIIFLMGLLGGIIALVSPLAIGKLYDEIIPEAEKIQIYAILLALVVAALSTAMFNLVRGFATARVKSKIGLNLESAIWDRLINLPANFFRNYTTGDLAVRANGINQIQATLSGVVLTSILSGIFSIFSFILLFKYSVELAFVALGLVIFSVAVNVAFMLVQVRYKAKIVQLSGEISGFLLELISGIQKLKIANATNRAYAKWAQKYAIKRSLSYRAGFLENYLQVFNKVFPLLTSIVIFAVITYALKENRSFSTGEYIAFNAAFGQYLSAALALSSAFLSVLNIKPVYERIKPIFEEVPEVQVHKRNPGRLNGDIDINNLSFKYDIEGHTILKDVNISIKSGEFVAIVGSSGSGKSTLLRLLLGFETPNEGNIFYSNHNLQDVDVRAIRSQLGVVLQNGRVMAGDIFTNIVGATNKTTDDAWSAAKMAGLDKDIEQMAMGMHTVVSEGGGTLSGGQQQRLLIARALINNPSIIFFDEATSALDNQTQAVVTKSLDALDATRIVIAHRLSTIIKADKIIVLEHGNIIQAGTYEELMEEEGLFKELALRQIA